MARALQIPPGMNTRTQRINSAQLVTPTDRLLAMGRVAKRRAPRTWGVELPDEQYERTLHVRQRP